jgi:hypothetical protein
MSMRRIAETLAAAGRPVDALPAGLQCVTLYREIGHPRGQAAALPAVGRLKNELVAARDS